MILRVAPRIDCAGRQPLLLFVARGGADDREGLVLPRAVRGDLPGDVRGQSGHVRLRDRSVPHARCVCQALLIDNCVIIDDDDDDAFAM